MHAALDSVQDDSPAASDVVVVIFGYEGKDFFCSFPVTINYCIIFFENN